MQYVQAIQRVRQAATLLLFAIGLVLVVISLSAELLGLDFTTGFGVVQMAQLLVGLTFLTFSGFLQIFGLRQPNAPQSLQADIGVRLALTGLIFCYVAGFSDLLQIGTHIERCTLELITAGQSCGPYAGPWQLAGITLGILSIVVGMLLYYTSRGTRHTSLLGFLLRDNEPAVSDEEIVEEAA